MIWNIFKLNRLLREALEAVTEANKTTVAALDLVQKWEELYQRQAERLAVLGVQADLKNQPPMSKWVN